LGNVVVTGFFEGGVDFGGGSLVSAGLSDIFVAKFNANGAHQWSQRFGSTGFDSGEAVAVDRSGNVLVTGGFEGTVDFGGGDLVGAGYKDVFVAKYDPSGAHEWSCRFGGTGYEEGYGIAVDGLESAVVTGYFEGGVDFGGGSLVSAGLEDIFVAKYDSSGTHHWSRRFGSTGSDYGEAVAVDGSGNVVVTGFFGGGVDFGGGSLTSAGLEDIFVAKYDSSGTHQWSQRFGSTGYDDGYGVAVDASGEVVATGVFEGTADFGGGDLISAGYSDIYVAKYNAIGAHEWSQRFGGTADDYGEDVAVDGSGKSLLTGEFIGTVNFGGGDLVSAGSTDIFLLKLGDEMPVPVLISRFDATPRRGGVELAWEFSSDEALKGFTLNRGRGQASAMIATGDARTTHSYMDVSVEPGETYEYELLVRTASGDEFSSPTVTVTMPRAVTALAQNLPNPFNPQTTISFTHAERARATLSVYDVKGRLVRTLVDEMIGEGYQERVWDGKDASGSQVGSGVYFYRLTAGDKTLTKKMVFLK
jgi:hypothetical protein